MHLKYSSLHITISNDKTFQFQFVFMPEILSEWNWKERREKCCVIFNKLNFYFPLMGITTFTRLLPSLSFYSSPHSPLYKHCSLYCSLIFIFFFNFLRRFLTLVSFFSFLASLLSPETAIKYPSQTLVVLCVTLIHILSFLLFFAFCELFSSSPSSSSSFR